MCLLPHFRGYVRLRAPVRLLNVTGMSHSFIDGASARAEKPVSPSTLNRRSALRLGVAATGAAALAADTAAVASEAGERTSPLESYNQPTGAVLPFLHGVASGDPLPNSVVLWTRVTQDRDALPGSGLGEDVEVEWEIARGEDFADIVDRGTVTATAQADHTVHIDPLTLEPDTVYYYRFHALGQTSPVGRTKTAPAADAEVDHLNFAVASCANYESGYFNAYKDMAQRARAGEIDFVVFLGDYIYEYAQGEYVGKKGAVRDHLPAWEIVTLEDYRMRYGRYRTDAHLQAAHAAAPWVVVWDDHETANNSWLDGAENHTPGNVEGDWHNRWNQALQAYFEWMPLRPKLLSEEGHLYRSLRFGNLMELTMMDLRSYRDEESASAEFGSPDRTILGSEQFDWLNQTIDASDATWMVMGNSVMMSPMRILTIPGNEEASEALRHIKGTTTGFAMNSDQWDGYTNDRDALLQKLSERAGNTFFVTGDIHSEWANSIFHNEEEIACELVTTSISAPNVDEILTQYTGIYHGEDNSTSLLVESAIRDANPWVKHVDYDAHGYAVARLGAESVEMNFYRVHDVNLVEDDCYLAKTMTWRPGKGYDA